MCKITRFLSFFFMSDTKRKINKQTLKGKEFLFHKINTNKGSALRVFFTFLYEKRTEWRAIKSKALIN